MLEDQGWFARAFDNVVEGTKDIVAGSGGDGVSAAYCENVLTYSMTMLAVAGLPEDGKNAGHIGDRIDGCDESKDNLDTSALSESWEDLSNGRVFSGLMQLAKNPDDVMNAITYNVGESAPEIAGGLGGAAAGAAIGTYSEPVSHSVGAFAGGLTGAQSVNLSKLIGEKFFEKLKTADLGGFSYDAGNPGGSMSIMLYNAARPGYQDLENVIDDLRREAVVEALIDTGFNMSVAIATAGLTEGLSELGLTPDSVEVLEKLGIDTAELTKDSLAVTVRVTSEYARWIAEGNKPEDFGGEASLKNAVVSKVKSNAIAAAKNSAADIIADEGPN